MWRVRHLWSIQDCRRALEGASYRGRDSGCSGVLQEFIISDIDEAADLLYIPGAEILSFDDGQIHPIDYEDTDSYQITKMFIENKEQLLKRLLSDEDKADF